MSSQVHAFELLRDCLHPVEAAGRRRRATFAGEPAGFVALNGPGAREGDRRRRWCRLAGTALAASCLAYLALSLAHHQAFHPFGRRDYFDLRVYHGAARLVLNGQPLYAGPIWRWAPFTYPPFAAVLFAPLALLPLTVDELLVTALGVACLVGILSRAMRLPSHCGHHAAVSNGWRSPALALAVAGALWLEPITSTLGYGQVNLLIALLIVWDLSRSDNAMSKGVLIGLAAGLKLTPLIFVPYLFFSDRRRAAGAALLTTAATVVLGAALLPGDTARFWGGGLFLDSARVGGCCAPANQSLRGVILNTVPSLGSGSVLLIASLIGATGLALAVRASLRGDEAFGFSLCALTGLLVSPVSWTHHWTLAVPALLLLGVTALRKRSKIGLTAFGVSLLVGYSYLPTLIGHTHAPHGRVIRLLWTLASAPYVLLALGTLAFALAAEVRALRQSHRLHPRMHRHALRNGPRRSAGERLPAPAHRSVPRVPRDEHVHPVCRASLGGP
jgi:alpha-1,2-mannosyltransferase